MRLFEKSPYPKHKVCGEFLSPETAPLLEDLGVWGEILAAGPARICRMRINIGSAAKTWRLPEPAFSLSRYSLDRLLLEAAVKSGSVVVRERAASAPKPVVRATGRISVPGLPGGDRIFGFKAHFEGPVNDCVELYFHNHCYVGVSAVEGRATNVCGLGPERVLRQFGFEVDELLATHEPLKERLAPLTRQWKWLMAGPLIFGNQFRVEGEEGNYCAGDALSFVDPFTGSGMLAAILTGKIAGRAAARGTPSNDCLRECRQSLQRPSQVAQLLRRAVATQWGEKLLPLVPAGLLYGLTRPYRTNPSNRGGCGFV